MFGDFQKEKKKNVQDDGVSYGKKEHPCRQLCLRDKRPVGAATVASPRTADNSLERSSKTVTKTSGRWGVGGYCFVISRLLLWWCEIHEKGVEVPLEPQLLGILFTFLSQCCGAINRRAYT